VRVAHESGISTSVVVIILVVVLAAAAVAAYVAFIPSSSANSTSSTSSTSAVQQTTTTGPMTESSSTAATTTTGPMTESSSTGTTTIPSSTTATTTSLTSCEATVTQTTTTQVNQLQTAFDALSQFKAISYELNITSQSTTTRESFTYSVTPSTGGLSEVNVTDTVARNSTSEVTNDLVWVNIGSMTVINMSEFVVTHGTRFNLGNFTGVTAETEFAPIMSQFSVYNTEYGTEYYSYFTNSQYFHSTGTQAMTFGPTTFDVTTYVANNTPETFNACGTMFTLDQWTLEIGTPPATSSTFVTYIHSVGSEVVNGTPESDNFTLALTSLTLA
jgi:hypothetical protein